MYVLSIDGSVEAWGISNSLLLTCQISIDDRSDLSKRSSLVGVIWIDVGGILAWCYVFKPLGTGAVDFVTTRGNMRTNMPQTQTGTGTGGGDSR